MPCRDYEDTAYVVESRTQKKLDTTTALLCALCKKLSSAGLDAYIPQPWWEEHQAQDAARKAAEKKQREREAEAKERDIARLTKELAKLKKTF